MITLLPLAAGATIWSGATALLDEECYVNLNFSEDPANAKKYLEPENDWISAMHIIRGTALSIGHKVRHAVGYRSDAFKACEESFAAGNAESGYWLGEYLISHGEEEEAENYYKQAAEMGDARALYALGMFGLFGEKFDMEIEQGFDYMRRAAEKGLMEAESIYSTIAHYTEYTGIAEDQVGAFVQKMLYQTVEKGDFESMRSLAMLYLYDGLGDSCLRRPDLSDESMEIIRANNADIGIICDEEQGVRYLIRAAESGMVPEAILSLAEYYEMKGDTEQALY